MSATNDNAAEAPVLTVAELCKRWKVARKTVLGAIRAGELHAFRVGERSYRVRLDDVLAFEARPMKAA